MTTELATAEFDAILNTKVNLDEPTNHLDLPSIEELETMLEKFPGAILYISHDTFFINRLGGDTIEL